MAPSRMQPHALGDPTSATATFEPLPLGQYGGTIGLLLAGLVVAGCSLLLPDRPSIAGLLVGLVATGVGVFNLFRRARSGGSIAAFERGVVIEHGGRPVAVPYDEVETLVFTRKEMLNNGVRTGVVRRFALRGRGGTTAVDSVAFDNRRDDVGEVMKVALQGLVDAALGRLRTNGRIAGTGWALTARGIEAKGTVVAMSDVTNVAMFQDQVSLWRGGEEQPFLSTPERSPNAFVLHGVVARGLAGRPAPPESKEGLGRVLFEKKGSRANSLIAGILGVPCLLMGAAMARTEIVIGLCVAAFGALLVGVAVAVTRSSFRAHERGIVKRSLFGQTSLLYANVERMTYAATRHYYNGVYTGTSISLKCAGGGTSLSFTRTIKGSESDLDSIREHIAKLIAGRYYERIKGGEEVAWANGIRLSRHGLRFNRSKLMGKGEELRPAWGDIRYSIDAGYLNVFVPGQNKVAIQVPCAADNFYPGLVLFEILPGEAASAAAGS